MAQLSKWCANKTCQASGEHSHLAACKLADLCHVHRSAPCEDYPGSWILFCGEAELYISRSFNNTFDFAASLGARGGECAGYSIGWASSEGDPRIGATWFTGFYIHGRWDILGRYITT